MIGKQVPQLLDLRVASVEEIRFVRPEASQAGIGIDAEIVRRAGRALPRALPAREKFLPRRHLRCRLRAGLIVHGARNSGRRRARSAAYSRNRSRLAASGL